MKIYQPAPSVDKYNNTGLTGTNLKMEDTPVGWGHSHGYRALASYTGDQLRRGVAIKDALPYGYRIPEASNDGRIQFVTRTMAAAAVKSAAPKPTALPEKAATPAAEAPAPTGPRVEIIRPLAEGQEHVKVALSGLRLQVIEILRVHGVHTKTQTPEQENGVSILSRATVVSTAKTAPVIKALVRGDALVGRVAQDQPGTHAQRVTSEGAQAAFLGAKAGRLPNAVALRVLGPALNNEASAAIRSIGTAGKTAMKFPGALIPIAQVTSESGIPRAAEPLIRHAITQSGLTGIHMAFDPSPAFTSPEAAAAPPAVAPPQAQQ